MKIAIFILTGFMLVSLPACSKAQSPSARDRSGLKIRPPAVAGAFYPGSSEALSRDVDELLERAPVSSHPGRIVALIVPHAGYRYSGQTAARAFKQLAGSDIKVIFLLGPCHRAYLPGVSIYQGDGYRTPLGIVPVDLETASWLRNQDDRFGYHAGAHLQEHSLEVELPFLQRVLKNFKIVPVLVGRSDRNTAEALGRALAGALEKIPESIIVCSTDMTHYPPYEAANRIDRETLEAIKSLDSDKVLEVRKKYIPGNIPNLSCTLCGENAVLATMEACRLTGVDRVEVLDYRNSGDVSFGDRSRVVGYGAVIFLNEDKMTEFDHEGKLDEAAQLELLRIARRALETYIREGKMPRIESENQVLSRKRGVFVTLTKQGKLRGCMGHFEQDTPLAELVARQVITSATGDQRFPPVRPEELGNIDIEISVLSPPEYVDSAEDIVVGKHGVILHKAGRGATFLPQVAPEQGWDRETMLAHLAYKAGLPPDAWKENCRFQVYTAQVFGEKSGVGSGD